jgi:hypothetical protein
MELNYNLEYPLILVFYMNKENFELGFFEQYTKLVSQTIEGSNIKAFFCPLSKGDKERIECINPNQLKKPDMEKIYNIVNDISEKFAFKNNKKTKRIIKVKT